MCSLGSSIRITVAGEKEQKGKKAELALFIKLLGYYTPIVPSPDLPFDKPIFY